MNDMVSSLLKTMLLKELDKQRKIQEDWHTEQLISKLWKIASGGQLLSKREAKEMIASALLDKSNNEGDLYETIKEILWTFLPRERTDLFFDFVDPLLKDSKVYWKLFRFVLSESHASKRHLSQIRKSLSRYGRLGGNSKERVQGSLTEDESYDGSALALYDSLEGEVVIYRGFVVSGTNRVRRSTDRNSPKYFQQNEGSGFSYTLDEDIALTFAARAAYTYTEKLAKMRTKGKAQLTNFQQCLDQFFYSGGHPYVGRYVVSKEDIVLVITDKGEDEIVANPDDVRLQSYKVLHSEDIYERFIKLSPDFPMPEVVKWDPEEFQEIVRHWEKPHMF